MQDTHTGTDTPNIIDQRIRVLEFIAGFVDHLESVPVDQQPVLNIALNTLDMYDEELARIEDDRDADGYHFAKLLIADTKARDLMQNMNLDGFTGNPTTLTESMYSFLRTARKQFAASKAEIAAYLVKPYSPLDHAALTRALQQT